MAGEHCQARVVGGHDRAHPNPMAVKKSIVAEIGSLHGSTTCADSMFCSLVIGGAYGGSARRASSAASTPSSHHDAVVERTVQLRIGRSKWPAVKRPAVSFAPVEYRKLPA